MMNVCFTLHTEVIMQYTVSLQEKRGHWQVMKEKLVCALKDQLHKVLFGVPATVALSNTSFHMD